MSTTAASPGTISHDFGSDNHAGTHPEVLRAIAEANTGLAMAYGEDEWTRRAVERLREVFGGNATPFFVFNGTAANVFGISVLLRRHQAVICAESAHLNTDECGAAERITGCKLLTVPAPAGKLTPDLVASRIGGRDVHFAQPGAVAISQATELGTCYTLSELRELAEFCASQGLLLYMDGARLANAAASLGCSLAELAGQVDVASFGGTKNGAMAAEAVIVMRDDLAADAPYLRKQQLQLASKMRFLAAQFLALLDGDLWLWNAQHANAMAQRLAAAVRDVPGVTFAQPVQANAIFAVLSPGHIERLRRDWFFHVWDERENVVRWMTSFATTEADVDAFAAAVRDMADGPERGNGARTAAGSAPGRVEVAGDARHRGQHEGPPAPQALTAAHCEIPARRGRL
jgi:threonine aldolase